MDTGCKAAVFAAAYDLDSDGCHGEMVGHGFVGAAPMIVGYHK